MQRKKRILHFVARNIIIHAKKTLIYQGLTKRVDLYQKLMYNYIYNKEKEITGNSYEFRLNCKSHK